MRCVQEFADFATAQDRTSGQSQPFELIYAIDGDKIGGMGIRLAWTSDAKWTKALKFMLVNLKYCLKWVVAHEGSSPAPLQQALHDDAASMVA